MRYKIGLVQLFAVFVVLLGLFAASFAFFTTSAEAADTGKCILDVQTIGKINELEMQLACPKNRPGYRYFDFGDNSPRFDTMINGDGSSNKFPHNYSYQVDKLNIYTAGIDFDPVKPGLEFTFTVKIDDRRNQDFSLGNFKYDERGVWSWDYTIDVSGTYTLSILIPSCDGLATVNDGHFDWVIDGPATGTITSSVEAFFVVDPETSVEYEVNGAVSGRGYLFGRTLGPRCKVSGPSLIAEDGPYSIGQVLSVTVAPAWGASSVSLLANEPITGYPDGCSANGINLITCEGEDIRNMRLSVQPGTESIVLYAYNSFEAYNVGAGTQIMLPLDGSPTLGFETLRFPLLARVK